MANNWPLHVTLVDVFATDWTVEEMMKELGELLASYPSASVCSIAKNDVFFGEKHDVRVTLLEKTTSLEKLHNDLLNMLEVGGLRLNNPEFAGETFRPHATVQRHTRLKEGDQVVVHAITLIDMFPEGNPYNRKILRTMPIASPSGC